MLSRQLNFLRTAPRVSSQTLRCFSTTNITRQEYEFPVSEAKVHKLDTKPNMTSKITGEEMMEIVTKMMTIRRFETSIGDLYKSKVRYTYYIYIYIYKIYKHNISYILY